MSNTKPVRKAVIPAAGLGTRVLPAAKAIPKEMLTVVDRPLIEYAVEEARASGIEEIVLVSARGKEAMENHFDRMAELETLLAEKGKERELRAVRRATLAPGGLTTVRQQEALGLGHAIWCACHAIGDEPFAVLLPDDLVKAETPCLAQLIDAHRRVGGSVAAVEDVPRDQTHKYGILDVVDGAGPVVRARGVVEKPAPEEAPSTLSIIGRYVLDADVMRELGHQKTGAGGEIQLTDAIARSMTAAPFHGVRFAGTRFDCGSHAGYVAATMAFALDHPEIAAQTAASMRRMLGDRLGAADAA